MTLPSSPLPMPNPKSVEAEMKHGEVYQSALRRLPLMVALLTLLMTPARAMSAPPGPAVPGGHQPVISDSFAVSSLWGGPWMVFVEGYDPNGDMIYLWFEVNQVGYPSQTEIVYLKGENRRNFKGYVAIYIPTLTVGWETVRAEIRAKDAAGNYSEKIVHEARVGAPTTEAVPAKWQGASFLGNIFLSFESDHDDQGRSSWRGD